MPRYPVRSYDELPEPPNCDDLHVTLREHPVQIPIALADAIRGVLSKKYGTEVDGVLGQDRDTKQERLGFLLGPADSQNQLQVHGAGCRLEYEEPEVTAVPPANTTTVSVLSFFIVEDK
jgi:hypothetical protein